MSRDLEKKMLKGKAIKIKELRYEFNEFNFKLSEILVRLSGELMVAKRSADPANGVTLNHLMMAKIELANLSDKITEFTVSHNAKLEDLGGEIDAFSVLDEKIERINSFLMLDDGVKIMSDDLKDDRAGDIEDVVYLSLCKKNVPKINELLRNGYKKRHEYNCDVEVSLGCFRQMVMLCLVKFYE